MRDYAGGVQVVYRNMRVMHRWCAGGIQVVYRCPNSSLPSQVVHGTVCGIQVMHRWYTGGIQVA